MLAATDLPTVQERRIALTAVPCAADLVRLTGLVRGSLANQAIDTIDASIGEENHARAALVALYEGLDALLQAAINVVESNLCEAVLPRLSLVAPLGVGEPLAPAESVSRMPIRLARAAVEEAAVLCASASDHIVNAHLRLAWEVNAATVEELVLCGFDPSEQTPQWWASEKSLRDGLRAARRRPLGVFASFALNAPFRACAADWNVRRTRRLRDHVVHRERPSYRNAPTFGRSTLWASARFSISYPPPSPPSTLATIADTRTTVGNAVCAVCEYVQSTWELARRWLRTIDVWIIPGDDETVTIQTHHTGAPRFPRASRDPGSFLAT